MRFQSFEKNLFIERKFACNFEHIKKYYWCKSFWFCMDLILVECCIFLLVLHFTSTMKFGYDFDSFHIVVIIQMDIGRSNYLICVKFHPMESHVFCCPGTYDLLIQMVSMLHYKYVGNIYIVVFILIVFVICFLEKLYNVVWFVIIVTCFDIFVWRWIALMQNHHLWCFPSFLLDFLCIKCAVTYSIYNSYIDIV